MFKVLREKNHQPRFLHPANLSFDGEGEIKTFLDKPKMRELVARTSAFQVSLEEVL